MKLPDTEGQLCVLYKKFFELSPDLLCIADTEGRFVKVNEAWARVLGYRPAELEGRSFLAFVHPEDTLYMAEKFAALKKDGTAVFINRYQCKEGSYCYIECRLQLQDGMMYGVARDVTLKIQQEQAIVQSDLYNKLLLAALPDFIFVLDPKGVLLDCRAGQQEDLLLPPSEFIGKNISQVLEPELAARVEYAITAVLRGEKVSSLEYSLTVSQEIRHYECKVLLLEEEKVLAIVSDITQRCRMETELRHERNLFSSGPVFTTIWAPKAPWEVRYISANVGQILGYTPAQLQAPGCNYAMLMHPEDLPRIQREVENNMAGGIASFEQSYRLRRSDGEYRWFYDFTVLDKNKDGQVSAIRGYLFEQTQLKNTEEDLEKERYRLENIIRGTHAGTWEWNVQTGATEFNERWAEIIGYTLAELQPVSIDTWMKYAHPDDLKLSAQLLELHFSGALDYYECESRMRHKNGSWVWVVDRGCLISRTPDGKPLMMYGTHQDITLRKQMEASLRESEERFRHLAEIFPETIYESDLSGKITYANKHAYQQFGCTEADLDGSMSIIDFAAPEEREVIRERIYDKLQGNDRGYLEYMARRKDGSMFPALGYASLIYKDSIPIGFRGFIMDITFQKNSEQELISAKEQAEVANNMKRQFLAKMSHEIRTPMNGILGYLDLLERSGLNIRQREFIREAKSASEMLLYLIKDILDFSKIEAGKVIMENNCFNLRRTVEDTVILLAPKGNEKNLEISLLFQPEVPAEIISDSARLRQIISNLISNAIKFTEQGEIFITVSSKPMPGNRAVIYFTIADTGIGISPEIQDSLFEPFTQADSSTTRRFGGTGLGLAISRELAILLGGDIVFTSKPDCGSVFHFHMEAAVAAAWQAPVLPQELQNAWILVVDENEHSRQIIVEYLQQAGCHPLQAARSEEALRQFLQYGNQGNAIALLASSVSGKTGRQLAAAFQATPFAQQLKIILVSPVTQINQSALHEETGFEYILRKPVRQEELLECLKVVTAATEKHQEQGTVFPDNDSCIPPKQPRMLLVEDNLVNRKLVLSMLNMKGISCDVAVDGQEALAAVQKNPYDIILMDCQMPVMDGYESTARIREWEGLSRHTVIIAMTANAMEGDREKCLQAGMDEYISKPVDFDRLFALLEQHKEQNQSLDSSAWEEHIEIFRTSLGLEEEDARSIFAAYMQAAAEIVSGARVALAAGDFQTVLSLAHKLKGASGNLRLTHVYEQAKQMEEAAARQEHPVCQKCLALIAEKLLK